MEPNKENINLNDEQRAAAYCDENAVVAAGAGSGKTMVLASRFAWLVTERKCRVREILTLTFTKKAAAQMYRRIHLMLAEIAVDSDIKGKLAREALEEFAQARIQTLDSYSAAIVKQAANRYGISPDFSIDEERCFRIAHDEAMSFFIAKRGHPAIKRLYPNKSPVSIANDFFAVGLFNYTHIDTKPNPAEDFTRQCNTICSEWKKQSGHIINLLQKINEANTENENYHPDLGPVISRFASGKVVFPNVQELGEYFEQLAAIPHDSIIKWTDSHPLQTALTNVMAFLLSLISLNLLKGKRQNNPAKEAIKELRVIFKEFSSLMVFCMQAGLTYSMLKLLSDLQYRYLDRKRVEGVLTYTDVARLAKTILIEQRDIRQSEKESFKAIMIDEFQDNNELQKDLLFLIAEKTDITNIAVPPAKDLSPGKLFFVGDEKQSVYLFRGADVSVFRKLKSELGSSDLPLKTNYRSAPVLIGAFNAIFGGFIFDPEGKTPLESAPTAKGERAPAVFAPVGNSLPPFEASFSPLHANKKNGGKLTLCILDKQDSSESDSSGDLEGEESERLSPVENEARYVAWRIGELLKEKNETGGSKYQPGDIAILFRTRRPQHLFEKHLMLLNIPYACEDLNGFFYGGPVDDLMSVLRLVAYPKDSAAYAQMLRSPFAGLSMQGLALCTGMAAGTAPFSDEPLSRLSEDDSLKYVHGKRIYQKILDIAQKESLSSLVSELWYGEGYRYETEWNPRTAAYRELYDYLFHLAALADEKNQGLAEFTDYIQSLYNADERLSDIEIPLERPSAVRLITIHKSKGLEFPVVFLCCCNKKGQNDFSGDLYHTDDSGLTFTPPLPQEYSDNVNVRRSYFWERSLAVRKEKRTAELRRLLYVGMTRAENELFLSGCLGISKTLGLENRDQNPVTENFSWILKQYIDVKIDKAAGNSAAYSGGIKGDSILEGNTFFGLCLPAFGAYLPSAEAAGDAFFHIERIPAYSEQQIRDSEKSGSRFSNDQNGLNAFLELVEPFYENAAGIETPDVPKKHFTPTSLHCVPVYGTAAYSGGATYSGDGHWTDRKSAYSGEAAADIFGNVDTLIEHYAKQHGKDNDKFNYGSFGTIAHICIEALLSNQEIKIPAHLTDLVSSGDADAILSAGKTLAQRFARSPLGNIARRSENLKSEFPFRSLLLTNEKEFFINGTIDLLFEDAETVYVVDFKTDSQELPGEHIAQMACYYRAASDLFAVPVNKKCNVWLYYLRTGHAVDVTMKAKNFDFGNYLKIQSPR